MYPAHCYRATAIPIVAAPTVWSPWDRPSETAEVARPYYDPYCHGLTSPWLLFQVPATNSKPRNRGTRKNPPAPKERAKPAAKRGGRRAPEPRRNRFKGWKDPVFKGLGGKIGSAFGPGGALVGSLADHIFGRIVGRGAYMETGNDVSQLGGNSLVKPLSSNSIPSMHVDTEGSIRVSKREFLGDITIRTAFTVTGLRIEPIIFPWLSQIALAFEKWIALGVVLEYVPTSGYAVASTSAALGTVSMCAVSDVGQVTNEFPVTKVDILTYQNSCSGSPAAPQSLGIECAPDQQQIAVKYVRDGSATAATFIAEQVVQSQVQIITGGSQNAAAANCGELWATYDILFLEPRKFNGPLPPEETMSPATRLYLTAVRQYSEALAAMHLSALTSDQFVSRNCEQQVLASKLQTPEMVAGRVQLRSQLERAHVASLEAKQAQVDASFTLL